MPNPKGVNQYSKGGRGGGKKKAGGKSAASKAAARSARLQKLYGIKPQILPGSERAHAAFVASRKRK
jgi:hypothetical protein